jgi:phosphatidyl-myo-inositol dimannoside synthase
MGNFGYRLYIKHAKTWISDDFPEQFFCFRCNGIPEILWVCCIHKLHLNSVFRKRDRKEIIRPSIQVFCCYDFITGMVFMSAAMTIGALFLLLPGAALGYLTTLWFRPTPAVVRTINRLAEEIDADLVVLDPALPLGLVGPRLERPYGLVLHGAEVTVPGRLPGPRLPLRQVLRGASTIVAAGGYPAAEAEHAAGRALPLTIVPPGVDVDRFTPLGDEERTAARVRLGLPEEGRVVVSVSRLVPRKGMDVLIHAARLLAPRREDLTVAIAGSGRDRSRLQKLVDRTGAPVRFLGRVPDEDLPALYAAGDVFAMLCRNRWAGLEQEGFGIVFLEAAACGVPQVAGRSGGAHEAVADGETGVVVRSPDDSRAVAEALARLLDDPALRQRMGSAARRRAAEKLSYDVLAKRLAVALP